MKHKLLILALAAAAVAAAQAQERMAITEAARVDVERQAAAGGVGARLAVESRVTKGAPYAAEAVTEFQQTLSDGNRISRRTVARIYRDSEGRTRREQVTRAADGKESVSILIVDPIAHTSFTLDPETRTAYRTGAVIAMPSMTAPTGMAGGGGGRGGGGGGGVAPVPLPAPPTLPAKHEETEAKARVALTEAARVASGQLKVAQERAAQGGGTTAKEDLGQRMVDGVMADGTRTTTVIPAGLVGNAQEIKVVSEQWLSQDLQLFVATKHSDPRSGETTYQLTNVIRAEQDRSLFEVPPDYTIRAGGGGRGRGSPPRTPGDVQP